MNEATDVSSTKSPKIQVLLSSNHQNLDVVSKSALWCGGVHVHKYIEVERGRGSVFPVLIKGTKLKITCKVQLRLHGQRRPIVAF